jgi:hypothetical protein
LGLAGVAVLALAQTSHAANGLIVQTIRNYDPYSPACAASPEPDCDAENAHVNGDAFWLTLLNYPGTTYTPQRRSLDQSVLDTDFHDPDLTGIPTDSDTNRFDQAGAAISFAYGHGTCDYTSTTTCTSDANCFTGSYCSRFGPVLAGDSRTCMWQKRRIFVTADLSPDHANHVEYGKSWHFPATKSFALGESPNSGSFGGAGTNGGTNVAVIINSCGIQWNYWPSNTTYMRAGVHSLLMTSASVAWRNSDGNHYISDTRDTTNRGSELANAIMNNINSKVKDGWFNPSMVNGGFVTNQPGGTKYQYGAHVMMASDATLALANWHVNNETWAQAKLDSNDATGNGFTAAAALCNYNCATYGL